MTDENNIKRKNTRKWLWGIVAGIVVISMTGGAFVLGNILATKGFVFQNVKPESLAALEEQGNVDKYSELFAVRNTILSLYDGEIDDEKLLEGAI